VLVHAWLDLAADAPPAVLHREFFHATARFGPAHRSRSSRSWSAGLPWRPTLARLGELTTDIDRFVYHQALSVFLCAPQALYAVNPHVAFDGYAATFELAETEVLRRHWSRR
jgi:hypothetical protein